MLLQVFLHTCQSHKMCREGPHSNMIQRSMLLKVSVHTVLVATKYTVYNGYTSVWINGVCFVRLNFGLIILPHNCRGKFLFSMNQWSMLFQVGLNSGHVDTKLADKVVSPVWLSGNMLFQVRLQIDHVIHFTLVFSKVSLLPKYSFLHSFLTNLSTIGLQTQKKYDHFLEEYLSRKFLIHILYTCDLALLIL